MLMLFIHWSLYFSSFFLVLFFLLSFSFTHTSFFFFYNFFVFFLVSFLSCRYSFIDYFLCSLFFFHFSFSLYHSISFSNLSLLSQISFFFFHFILFSFFSSSFSQWSVQINVAILLDSYFPFISAIEEKPMIDLQEVRNRKSTDWFFLWACLFSNTAINLNNCHKQTSICTFTEAQFPSLNYYEMGWMSYHILINYVDIYWAETNSSGHQS